MCGKGSLNSPSLSDSGETEQIINHSPASVRTKVSISATNGEVNNKSREDETPEEKSRRRKLERRKRKLGKMRAIGEMPLTLVSGKSASKKFMKQFNAVWDNESAFVTRVMQCLPEVRQPGMIQEEEERSEDYLLVDDVGDEGKEKEKVEKFFAKVRRNLEKEGMNPSTELAKSSQELKERLQRKLAELAQQPNEKKREKKHKRKEKRALEAKSNKGKKLISQSAKSAGAASIKTEESNTQSQPENQSSSEITKTPLQKKPVVKSNGEIVYSKFDFISKHKGDNTTSSFPSASSNSKKIGKPTPDELLKKAEKHEKKISNLAKIGKQSEAVSLVESQKWDTAMKRADGDKVRDDAYLLKKSIKRQEKLKQLSKKKWKERVDRVEKQKDARQQKRQSNLQSRQDDKKKKVKKIMRKRGRIA